MPNITDMQPHILPRLAPGEECYFNGERTPVRIVQNLGVTLAWKVSLAHIKKCKYVAIFQRPTSVGAKCEFFVAKILDALEVKDMNIKHLYYNNCLIHQLAAERYNPSALNALARFRNATTMPPVTPYLDLDRVIIIFENKYTKGPIASSFNGLSIDEYLDSLLEEINNQACGIQIVLPTGPPVMGKGGYISS